MTAPKGLIITAPASGSGKTLVTLGLLRALRDAGTAVVAAKAGPDYIDPAFLGAASGAQATNLDSWAMRPETLSKFLAAPPMASATVIVEGVMGLFDGVHLPGRPDAGSTADLAALTGWPVVLVVDAGKQAASVGALVRGFATLRDDVRVAGVIFNRVASEAHAAVLADATHAAAPDVRILGAVARDAALAVPERHLGLVQAEEHEGLEQFITAVAKSLSSQIDLEALTALATPAQLTPSALTVPPVPPLAQRIAVAQDRAFAFTYPTTLDGWRDAGAEILAFSPLANEAPDPDAGAVYLPGGYPELHASVLADADVFLSGIRDTAGRGTAIFGECGGYMVLGRGLVDADGVRHAMAGLLPVETSFATRRLHLGYRVACLQHDGPLGPAGTRYRGHEFHYATILDEKADNPLFAAENARGESLGHSGAVAGSVAGSFIHLIDRTAA